MCGPLPRTLPTETSLAYARSDRVPGSRNLATRGQHSQYRFLRSPIRNSVVWGGAVSDRRLNEPRSRAARRVTRAGGRGSQLSCRGRPARRGQRNTPSTASRLSSTRPISASESSVNGPSPGRTRSRVRGCSTSTWGSSRKPPRAPMVTRSGSASRRRSRRRVSRLRRRRSGCRAGRGPRGRGDRGAARCPPIRDRRR